MPLPLFSITEARRQRAANSGLPVGERRDLSCFRFPTAGTGTAGCRCTPGTALGLARESAFTAANVGETGAVSLWQQSRPGLVWPPCDGRGLLCRH